MKNFLILEIQIQKRSLLVFSVPAFYMPITVVMLALRVQHIEEGLSEPIFSSRYPEQKFGIARRRRISSRGEFAVMKTGPALCDRDLPANEVLMVAAGTQ